MVRTYTSIPPPEGWEIVKDRLEEFEKMMRNIDKGLHQGRKKNELMWPIFQINHLRSRYLYNLYYIDKSINKELYEYCLKQGHGDRELITKWKKPGYEYLCCMNCITNINTNYGTTCICRVPKADLNNNISIECSNCGCTGCSS
ncbi:G10 protein, putative [Cryptosporidium muris RN66]|uniref:G10 protein, putative n=1 Tax=Cryptosporidium muris (strain RN66) TaxID=441375 RepID=B6AFC3_CRYMR|nr:G10 protein, putative [Cryptosporidium muris RN66]EEA06914.1 G10 protein, putative [Cryptosporidium muris RN66]|eukprot:XP_002141263.1 G10 protein [Cryptosporidium muris RN66]